MLTPVASECSEAIESILGCVDGGGSNAEAELCKHSYGFRWAISNSCASLFSSPDLPVLGEGFLPTRARSKSELHGNHLEHIFQTWAEAMATQWKMELCKSSSLQLGAGFGHPALRTSNTRKSHNPSELVSVCMDMEVAGWKVSALIVNVFKAKEWVPAGSISRVDRYPG